MKPNLEVRIGALRMKNPVTVASGTFGYGQEYARYFDIAALGAVTIKSITLKPRAGNAPPRLVETPAGILNAIGLQNVGLDAYLAEKAPFLRKHGATIIANIYGSQPDEYCELARRLEEAHAADAIEANLSCPNVHDAATARGPALVAQIPERVAEYSRALRAATKLPLLVKLTPNVADIVAPATAAEGAGADAVSLVNTFRATVLDRQTLRPFLGARVGGLCGPAIKPIALRMVAEVAAS
ncbi:MAG TPA: dihydroorotate dehydrogenase, partial [Candidatus Hydrogenedentes bacterium]|nr:dihydroorotate dehydrogenase [Candidatus Hydrogenedentota bacterium]